MSASGPSGPLVIKFAHSFTKNQNMREYLPLFGFSDATTAKGPGCDEGTNLR